MYHIISHNAVCCSFHSILFNIIYVIIYHIISHHLISHLTAIHSWHLFHVGNQQKSEAPAITVQVLSNRAFIKPKACAPTSATPAAVQHRCHRPVEFHQLLQLDGQSFQRQRIEMPRKQVQQHQSHILNLGCRFWSALGQNAQPC